MKLNAGIYSICQKNRWPCIISLYAFALLFIIVGCQKSPAEKWEWNIENIHSSFPTVKHVSTDKLYKWINDPEADPPILIDRRAPEEYAVSHIHGAFPAVDIKEALHIINREGIGRPVVVYCSVGYRSSALAEKLQEQGVTKVYNLEGSIFKWANEGKEIYRGNTKVAVVHPFDSEWRTLLQKIFWYKPNNNDHLMK